MNALPTEDMSAFSMHELFRLEAENQVGVLTENLLQLEGKAGDAGRLETLMRAAHSIKGAARIVGRDLAVRLAHELETSFVAAQEGSLVFAQEMVDRLLRGVDLLQEIAQVGEGEAEAWDQTNASRVTQFLAELAQSQTEEAADPRDLAPRESFSADEESDAPVEASLLPGTQKQEEKATERSLRVTAASLDRLLLLAAESQVESGRLAEITGALARLKRQQAGAARALDQLRALVKEEQAAASLEAYAVDAQTQLTACRELLADRLVQIKNFDRRLVRQTKRVYEEALACRMRPFSEGIRGFPRMVRDLARELGKQVQLEVSGAETEIDRDLLEQLESPLTHLLRNALDHGIETPEMRAAAGKPEEGVIRLGAFHRHGHVYVQVADDGRGISLPELRTAIVQKGLARGEAARAMSDTELLEFLFLPGFTLKKKVTEISGRGVGLDAVQAMVRKARGTISITSNVGQGTIFHLQLPLSLSILRALLVQIAGELYALPLVQVTRVLKMKTSDIHMLDGRAQLILANQQVGLVAADEILGKENSKWTGEQLPVLLIGDKPVYGLIVDQFLGERDLMVQRLDPRLGKINNISAGALLHDAPVLILDVADLMRSAEKLLERGSQSHLRSRHSAQNVKNEKRVLVVDDSLTVRQLEKKLLESRGYQVDVAVDGMDGWNAVRSGQFDLVVTDVDMPRLDGIEFVALIKRDHRLRTLPVLIISYKDRAEDRKRGLEAGADYYLAKSNFHEDTLLEAVINLIGEPQRSAVTSGA